MKADANPEASTNEKRNTPLHFAAMDGHAEIVKSLIEFDSNLKDVSNAEGFTALQLACTWGETDVVRLLLPNSLYKV